MTGAEQEALFAKTKAKHSGWSNSFVSGFVHGTLDEARRKAPLSGMKERTRRFYDEYATGYLVGFAVVRGSDVELESWFTLKIAALVAQERGL